MVSIWLTASFTRMLSAFVPFFPVPAGDLKKVMLWIGFFREVVLITRRIIFSRSAEVDEPDRPPMTVLCPLKTGPF